MRKFLLPIIVVIAAVLYSSMVVVTEGTRGIMLRFNKVQRDAENKVVVYEPGLHFKLPLIDSIKVLDAQGEVERLQRLLPEFKAAPDLLKERLYIQTMEKVMANTPKVMLDSNNGNNLTVLPLEQLMGKKATKPVTTTSESAVSSAPASTQERRVETQAVQPVQSNEGIRQGRFN